MNAREQGFLLLTSHLGNPVRKPLTMAQFRNLAQAVLGQETPKWDRELMAEDLLSMGYDPAMAKRIVDLLEEEELLAEYLQTGKRHGCQCVSRVNPQYPLRLRKRMGLDAPGCLWTKGDISLLTMPAVALVGSRELGIVNEAFAAEVGEQAAKQGYALVSGNAKGADTVAQESALYHGGCVISVVADALQAHSQRERVLYLAEGDYDTPFSAQRALSRNRIIHSLGAMTFVAQCTKGKGGSWDGSLKNLKHGYSPLFVLDDGSAGAEALLDMGAEPIKPERLQDLSAIKPYIQRLTDQ